MHERTKIVEDCSADSVSEVKIKNRPARPRRNRSAKRLTFCTVLTIGEITAGKTAGHLDNFPRDSQRAVTSNWANTKGKLCEASTALFPHRTTTEDSARWKPKNIWRPTPKNYNRP
jgi:hypothetical protein